MRVFIFSIFAAATLIAQHGSMPPGERPAVLLPGLGRHTWPIQTKSPEAQKFFDQGLNLLYGFNRYEALRSFRRAADYDPQAPMPRWGIAAALGPHINMDGDGDVSLAESCNSLAEARSMRISLPQEQALIEAAWQRCPDGNHQSYASAMRKVFESNPDDLDVATLYAESLMIPHRWKWFNGQQRPAPGTEEAIQVLEAVIRRYSDHPGANHFYIHAVESSATPERAIPSAQRLMGIVPSAGHLVHMPAHIWMVLGEYARAAEVNERAAQVDREYFEKTGVNTSAYMGYYLHNLHFVVAARSMQGRKTDTYKAAGDLVAASRPMIEMMPSMADYMEAWGIMAKVRFSDWDGILSTAKPSEKMVGSTALWHASRAMAYHAGKHKSEAASEAAAFTNTRKRIPDDWLWMNNKAGHVLDFAGAIMRAKLAADPAGSVSEWQRAVALQDEFIYDEPPPWIAPVRESLGAALLRAGRSEDAEKVFREALRRSPKNGRVLFGLWKTLEVRGNKAGASAVQREFERTWKSSDVVLSIEEL